MSWSHVTIDGDLLSEPELRYAANGRAVTTFRISAGRKERPQPGCWEDPESWVEVACFDSTAENVAESMRLGDRAVVVGRLSRHSWHSEDGSGTKLTVRAVTVGASTRRATVKITAARDVVDREPLPSPE